MVAAVGRAPNGTSPSSMMTLSNGNIFRVTGHLYGEFTGHRWISAQNQWRGALMFSLICTWINGWVNNGEAGDLRRHHDHHDVTVMAPCWLQREYICKVFIHPWFWICFLYDILLLVYILLPKISGSHFTGWTSHCKYLCFLEPAMSRSA